MMPAVSRLTQESERSVEADSAHSLREDRYWGISAILERIDGRLVREEYYARLANHAIPGSIKASIG